MIRTSIDDVIVAAFTALYWLLYCYKPYCTLLYEQCIMDSPRTLMLLTLFTGI